MTDCLIHRQTDKLYKLFVKHTHTLTLHTFSLDARADITIRTIYERDKRYKQIQVLQILQIIDKLSAIKDK